VNGEIKDNIPNSAYFNNTVIILSPSDSYHYEVVGTEDGSYGLAVAIIIQGESNTFTATDIPISANAVHRYTINWTALSQGEKGINVQIDSDGDGSFEKVFSSDSELSRDEFMQHFLPAETIPMWIIGAVIATIALVTIAIAAVWIRQKKPSARPEAPSKPVGEVKYCTKCGASIPLDAAHCPKCGQKQP